MNFSADQLLTLAAAFGELARGAKKIRGVLLQAAGNQSVTSAPSPATSECESSESDSEPEPDSIQTENFVESAAKYLYTKKMVWSKLSAQAYFVAMVRNRLRMNALKFCWAHTGGSLQERKHWTKISRKSAESIYSKIKDGWEDICEEINGYDTRPPKIRASKWERRQAVLQCTFPKTLFSKKGYRQILVDYHDDLPSLK
jgi:hypothetical protein